MEYYADMDSDRQVAAMTLTADNVTVISVWANAMVVEEIDPFDAEVKFPGLNVQCKSQVKRASLGDKVIKHGDGTYDVLTPMAFLGRYVQLNG